MCPEEKEIRKDTQIKKGVVKGQSLQAREAGSPEINNQRKGKWRDEEPLSVLPGKARVHKKEIGKSWLTTATFERGNEYRSPCSGDSKGKNGKVTIKDSNTVIPGRLGPRNDGI